MEIDINKIENNNEINQEAVINLFPENSILNIEEEEIKQETIGDNINDYKTNTTVIATMKTAEYGGLIKIIETVSKKLDSQHVLVIEKGKINVNLSNGYIFADLTLLFGNNDWELKDPNGALKILKLIKGSHQVSILNDEYRYIIINEENNFVRQKVELKKVVGKASKIKNNRADPGELKYKMELDSGKINNLIGAKKSLEVDYYNLQIDADTKEVVNININNEFEENFLTSTGRNIINYRANELFPVSKAEETIFELFELPDGTLTVVVSFNDALTSIKYQIALRNITNLNPTAHI